MVVAIIGLGLIGGSLAIDLKKRGFASHVIGVDNNIANSNIAIREHIVDEIMNIDNAIKKSELIILACPVDVSKQLLTYILNNIDNQTVTDMGSTKASIIQSVRGHAKRGKYVAAHPMAGTEFSGPMAAFSGLFDGKCSIICNRDESEYQSIELVTNMFNVLLMKCIYMQADVHDRQTAYISHLSHISAFALSTTVLQKEKKDKHIFELASGGFDSTVRLAKSSADMWVPIFTENKDNITKVLERYINSLSVFKHAIENQDYDKLHLLISESNDIKRVLDAKDEYQDSIKIKTPSLLYK